MKPFCLPLPFRPRATYHNVLRARIVLAAARGKPNAAIDAGLLIHVDTVHNWRKRYATGGLEGLKDLTRTGRRTFTPVQVAGIKALACTPPQQKDVSMANSLCPRAASRNAWRAYRWAEGSGYAGAGQQLSGPHAAWSQPLKF
jgi:hypothetical protein